MKGAREYVPFLKDGVYGRLYVKTGRHARGYYLHVYVLKEGFDETQPLKGAVEVYGVINGEPGWSEEYGWLHHGPWKTDFELLITSGRLAKETEESRGRVIEEKEYKEQLRQQREVLNSYPKESK